MAKLYQVRDEYIQNWYDSEPRTEEEIIQTLFKENIREWSYFHEWVEEHLERKILPFELFNEELTSLFKEQFYKYCKNMATQTFENDYYEVIDND